MISHIPTKLSFIPLRIKQARVSRVLSQEDLAREVGVTKQAISQYETGSSKPSEFVMLKISDTLKYPLTFFTNPPKCISTARSASFFRSYKTAAVKDKVAWEQKVEIFEENVLSKLREYITFPRVNLPVIEQQDTYTMEDCEDVSVKVRDYWGLGIGPIDNLIDVIQENGIIVSKFSTGKKIDAFSTIYNGTPYIYISDNTISSVRWRFSLAHELGHLVLHSGLFEDDIPVKTHDKLEQEANYFASAFLMPRESFFNDVTIASLDHFLYLKKKWKTSISSMIMKCKNFNILSQDQAAGLFRKMAVRKWGKAEPLDDICQNEKPYLLKQAFKLLIDNNIISPSGTETDFGIYADELIEWAFLPKEFFTPVQIERKPLKLQPSLSVVK